MIVKAPIPAPPIFLRDPPRAGRARALAFWLLWAAILCVLMGLSFTVGAMQ